MVVNLCTVLQVGDEGSAASATVTAAEIARLAGVTRAAVSNWRRRYDDFPAPAGGTATSPLFALSDVQGWLEKQRKGQDVSGEVLLWQALRAAYGDDMIRALTAVGAYLADERDTVPDTELRKVIDALSAERSPQSLFTDLVSRYLAPTGRGGTEPASTPRLVRAVQHFAGTTSGVVYDPACGIGSLLLAAGGPRVQSRTGQEIDTDAARLAQLRAQAAGESGNTRIATGDSLRSDLHRELRAELVVCEPPVGVAEWGRKELLLDARWEMGVPSRAESELAWLQHCYFHTAPGGRAVLALPASVAYRKAGRRIRAELVCRGVLTGVVALPPGTASTHTLPLHLWILRRPVSVDDAASTVRMVDLTSNDPDGPVEPTPQQVADVPLIELLDDAVDLTPGRYVVAPQPDYPTEYATARAELERRLRELLALLPPLSPGPGPGSLDGATVGVSDLARAGLVNLDGREPVSASDQLDTDYLQGFVRSAANTRRSTSASRTYRADPRNARLPQMEIERQRQYGAAFRLLTEFERGLGELARMGDRTARLARDGLTSGALSPPTGGDGEQTTASDEARR